MCKEWQNTKGSKSFFQMKNLPCNGSTCFEGFIKRRNCGQYQSSQSSKVGSFLAFGDFIGLSISIWEKHFLSLISTFCYILFMFEKQTSAQEGDTTRGKRNRELKQKFRISRTFQIWIKISSLPFVTPIFVICRLLTKENMKKFLP